MLVYVLFVFSIASAHGLQVNTTEGVVEGNKATDGEYYVFYGIPYAGPTSGRNRFKGPVPPSRYPGVFHAIDSNVICAQPTARGLVGVENCLTLSVYTKNVTTPKPVVVWLNSNEYTNTDTQMFTYRKLVSKDIVFVPMNFRLSIFGFLCLGVHEAPGNAGLRDVIQGLKWIQANIASFGGNPNDVTLMGHASGAAIVDLLTISPQIKNLVHKGIALSGSSLSPWAVAYDPIGYANLLGAKLGYAGKTREALASHLITTDINVLITELNNFKFYNNTPLFAPCIENSDLNLNDTVLAEAPIIVLRSGKYAHIPFIYGYTTREGTMRAEEAVSGNWLSTMETNFTSFLQVDLEFGNNKTAVAKSIRDFYFSSRSISMETIEDYLDYEGDTLVLVSVIKAAKERALTSTSEVRLLEFGYIGTKNSFWGYNQVPISGAAHGAFLNYLFEFDLRPTNDQNISDWLVTRISGFVHSWNSTATGSVPSTNTWAAITKESTNYLFYGGHGDQTVNNTPTFTEEARFNPHVQRMSFWDGLYTKYYVAPIQASSSNVVVVSVLVLMLCQLLTQLF